MHWLTDPQTWASLLTLTILEIVLGIDNLVFIAILTGRLPPARQARAGQFGLALALITRLALLAAIVWLTSLTRALFEVFGHAVSWRDLVLIGGGLFLLYKGTRELHHRLEGDGEQGPGHKPEQTGRARASFIATIGQIAVLDIVFSLDSVITAVGMANNFWIMATAIVIAVAIMLKAVGPLAVFIAQHPTVTMLALSFLLLIGMTLIADGAGFDVPKGYIYGAIGFSVGVEALNQVALSRRKRREQMQPHVRR